MSWPFSVRTIIYSEEKCIWAQIRILHETKTAILADNGRRFWIPKSRIKGIRLKSARFEVYVEERVVG